MPTKALTSQIEGAVRDIQYEANNLITIARAMESAHVNSELREVLSDIGYSIDRSSQDIKQMVEFLKEEK